MPRIRQLNHPPHPFWDFVQEMNDHPMWSNAQPQPQPQPQPAAQRGEATQSTEANDAAHKEQAQADDPPEVDPATLNAEGTDRRGRGRRGRDPQHTCRGRRHEGHDARHGFQPFGAWGAPPFGMPGGFPDHQGPPPHMADGRGPHHHNHRGRPHHHHHHGPRGRHSPPPPPNGGFNLGQFLNDLGDRIGVDLQGAAQGLGIDKFMPASTDPEVDFEPKVDIFESPEAFTVHASLPGAKKEDVGVDWDGEHSTLRLTGVVHRPDVDEETLKQLIVDGRKREVGVFEKAIRLGTKRDPATVDVAGIKAKMADGVLIVRVPKAEKQHQRREVPISGATASPPRYSHIYESDHEVVMQDATNPATFEQDHPVLEPTRPERRRSVTLEPESTVPQYPVEHKEKGMAFRPTPPAQSQPQQQTQPQPEPKQAEEKPEPEYKSPYASLTPPSPATVVNKPFPSHTTQRPLKRDDESDWENFYSDEEGEFVKINVD